METQTKTTITVSVTVNAPVEKAWKHFTSPQSITQWNNASDDWYCPRAENDLRPGGKFSSRMEAKDGSVGFDFWGIYDAVVVNKFISYTMGDGRKAEVNFTKEGTAVKVTTNFEAETENSIELQRGGWQAILDNFKKYTESH